MLSIKHGKNKRFSLDEILTGPDEFGLLDVKAKQVSSSAPLEVLKFEEINTFIDTNSRKPDSNSDLTEKLMARRLQSYIENAAFHDALQPYDRYGLLPKNSSDTQIVEDSAASNEGVEFEVEPQPSSPKLEEHSNENVSSLDDILNSTSFSNMDLGEQSIFEITHVPSIEERSIPDEIAQQTVCEDFYKFEGLFKELQSKLKTGELKHVPFQKELQVREGDAFIMEGVLCFVDDVGEYREDNQGRYNPRLRIIFENGTESNHLLRSFGRRMYKDKTSKRVIPEADSVVDAFSNITHKDKRAGQIYFVTTKSENPTLKNIPNLIKIGYTEQTVEERTKYAERDTAFLEAPVKLLATMECYNLNPNKFETLIHGFLYAQRLKITLTGKNGKEYHPNEWFSVPLDVAMEVAKRIIDGSIVKYRMDNTTSRLVKKEG